MDKEQLKKQLSKPGFAYISSGELREIAYNGYIKMLSRLLDFELEGIATQDDVDAFMHGKYTIEIVADEYDDGVTLTAGRDLNECWNDEPWMRVTRRELFTKQKKTARVH